MPRATITKRTPKLWNAKRRIDTSKYVDSSIVNQVRNNPDSEDWKRHVSRDVADFLTKSTDEKKGLVLIPEQKIACLRNPVKFFSRPENVHPELRKQIYLPDFTITLMRTTHLPPKYAAFDVPLWFNKLDIKSYLRSAYNVDILHVRSSIFQSKVKRRQAINPLGQGALYRPPARKKMTVELVEPFVWPEEIQDLSPWEKDTYWQGNKAQFEQQRKDSDWAKQHPDNNHRKSIAEQAKELLSGKTTWSPTWREIPMDVRAMGGRDTPPTSSP